MLRAFSKSEVQAHTDPLTGLMNRRSLEVQVRALTEEDRPYIVAYGDLDHFKQLNDVYGHDAGDRALRLFARVAHSLRPNTSARYGGEEFVVGSRTRYSARSPSSIVAQTCGRATRRHRAAIHGELRHRICPARYPVRRHRRARRRCAARTKARGETVSSSPGRPHGPDMGVSQTVAEPPWCVSRHVSRPDESNRCTVWSRRRDSNPWPAHYE